MIKRRNALNSSEAVSYFKHNIIKQKFKKRKIESQEKSEKIDYLVQTLSLKHKCYR